MRCVAKGRHLLGALTVAAFAIGFPIGAQAQTGSEAPQFSGSASAVGVNINLNITGFPATDVPVDSGGPTAQALADSSGFQSTAYAAFPDPGEFFRTAPGLVPGLVEGGVAGLPPVEFPSPPDYPFYVQTNPSNPNASLGAGPYELTAESRSTSSRAEATGGLRQTAAGNAALVMSSAFVGPRDGGSVVSEAITDFEGLRIGPLSMGRVRSVARQTLDEFGEVRTETDLVVSSFSVGGVAVNLTEDGLDLAGVGGLPIPINDTLADLLSSSGLSVEYMKAQEFDDRVVAPGLRVTMPFTTPQIPNVGQFPGIATITIGQATASLLVGTSGPLDGFGSEPLDPGGTSVPSFEDTGTGSLDLDVADLGGSTDLGAIPDESGTDVAAPTPNVSGPSEFQPAATIRPEALFGIESIYLLIVAGALLAAAGGNLIQRLGGRAA